MMGLLKNSVVDNRGIALLLAVTVISLLVAVTVQFGKDMRQELVSSANILSSAKMSAIIKSGHNIAEAVLIKDGLNSKYDTGLDEWATLDDESLDPFYAGGKLDVLVTDLGGRIQLNSLINNQGKASGSMAQKTREALLLLFLSGDLGDYSTEDAALIVDAITDWVDSDDQESGVEETESSYYLSLQPPYTSKNAPMEFVEELLLVRGVTPELFFGTVEFTGLKDLVTVHGRDGKININTAPPQVLKTLSADMSDELAEKMVAFRLENGNSDLMKDVAWYNNIDQWPGDVVLEADRMTTSSSYFRVISSAENNEMVKTMTSIVRRETGGKVFLISRKVD